MVCDNNYINSVFGVAVMGNDIYRRLLHSFILASVWESCTLTFKLEIRKEKPILPDIQKNRL